MPELEPLLLFIRILLKLLAHEDIIKHLVAVHEGDLRLVVLVGEYGVDDLPVRRQTATSRHETDLREMVGLSFYLKLPVAFVLYLAIWTQYIYLLA